MAFSSIEFCAGAGGQALGLEQAGFEHVACVEIDSSAVLTLRKNRPHWNIIEADMTAFDANPFVGTDLFAAGLPCPPFSVAGKQLGEDDERNLFPAALERIQEILPRAVMIENVRGILDPEFDGFRQRFQDQLAEIGFVSMGWRLLNASDFGVAQLRPRVIFVALAPDVAPHFVWPTKRKSPPRTVGATLLTLMASKGWEGAVDWAAAANGIAPTLVGGSKKHGGPDLGPTRAKSAWADLGVNGHTIADEPPGPGFQGMPRLTVKMAARIQGFPSSWKFVGKKTATYRQVGNAFPPPVARAVGRKIAQALMATLEAETGVAALAN